MASIRTPSTSSGSTPTSAPPPIAPPAAPAATSPLDGALFRPPLQGMEEALDITTMTRSRVSWTLKVDHGWLARLDASARAGLIAACAADPAWRVVEEHGVTVAHRRTDTPTGWTVSRTGYHTGLQGDARDATWRVDLRFGAWPSDDGWTTSPHVARATAEARQLVVKAFSTPGVALYGARATAVSVDGPQVAFDVYELGSDDARTTTITALLDLANHVPTVAWTVANQLQRGEDVRVPGVVSSGEPGLAVDLVDGQLDVRGWVNPGVPGWTFVRVLGPSGPWEDAAVGAGTRERVGWASDATRTFWMQGRFPVPAGPGFHGTAEVWVQPDDGGPVRRVASYAVDVPERGAVAVAAAR